MDRLQITIIEEIEIVVDSTTKAMLEPMNVTSMFL